MHRVASPSLRRALLVSAPPTEATLRARRLPRALAPLLAMPTSPAWMERHVCVRADLDRPGSAVPADALVVHRLHDGESPLHAAARLIDAGVKRLFLASCDCPDLAPGDLAAADDLLDTVSLVIGSNPRGRLYLLALRASRLSLLHGLPLEADGVAGELLRRAGGDAVETLPAKITLDTPADVRELACSSRTWRRRLRTLMNSSRVLACGRE
jgi:hypothetical protein